MSDLFRALADPTRREILSLLRDHPHSSGDIARQFDSTWPTISRHLSVLKNAGLITSERHGQEIVYELNTTTFQDLMAQLAEWAGPSRKKR